MVFSFAQLSAALGAMHRVADTRATAFQARLKHYQRNGYPNGINTGRGRAASYHIDHALKLALVLELNQMGLSPERAISVATYNLSEWSLALRMTVGRMLQGDPLPTFIYFDPSALNDLQAEDSTDLADATFEWAGLGQFFISLKDWSGSFATRLALINVSNMASRLAANLSDATGIAESDIILQIMAWAERDHDGDD